MLPGRVHSYLVAYLFGALSPVNHKGLHQGWKQTSIYLQVIHSTNHYATSPFISNHNSNHIHNFGMQTQKNNNTCFGAYLYSAGTQHGNLHPAGWPILFCGPTQEPVSAAANAGKTREVFFFLKNAGEWTGRVKISKEEIPGLACMAIYWPTPGFKGRVFELCVLNRLDFNFSVRSSPLRELFFTPSPHTSYTAKRRTCGMVSWFLAFYAPPTA